MPDAASNGHHFHQRTKPVKARQRLINSKSGSVCVFIFSYSNWLRTAASPLMMGRMDRLCADSGVIAVLHRLSSRRETTGEENTKFCNSAKATKKVPSSPFVLAAFYGLSKHYLLRINLYYYGKPINSSTSQSHT